jgi:poly(ADP-ribose) glycohydrolase ARH3
MPTLEQFQGCLLGLALGDAFGAPHEGGPLERFLWRVIGRRRDGRRRWTDDTQMTIDLAESWLANKGINQDDLARRFARSYRWSRGYGPGATKLLKRIKMGEDWRRANREIYPDGSYGNGAAMRAPLLGLVYRTESEVLNAARLSGEITHAHPLAIEGSQLVAMATYAMATTDSLKNVIQLADSICQNKLFAERLEIAKAWLGRNYLPTVTEVRQSLGNGIAAHESCITAIYVAHRFLNQDFQELLDYIIALRGDVDTIAAMAGAIWGTKRGSEALPKSLLGEIEDSNQISLLAEKLYQKSQDV